MTTLKAAIAAYDAIKTIAETAGELCLARLVSVVDGGGGVVVERAMEIVSDAESTLS